MAKIDTSKIEGYADMTAEQKLAALESFEYEDLSGEVTRYKNAVTKANGEAAEWKRKHNALLSEEELKKQQTDDSLKQMQIELETLRKEKTVSGYKAKYLAMGYDEELATATASALADGDQDTVFSNQLKFQQGLEKKLRSDALKNNPIPPAGTGTSGMDYSKLIADAYARNDYASAAAYMRKAQESTNT